MAVASGNVSIVRSDRTVLRPVAEADLAVLERFIREPDAAGPFECLSWIDPGLWPRQWADNGLLGEDGGKLMVDAGSAPVGFVGWQKVGVSRTAYCWNISIALLPEARGRGHGSRAQRLLVDYLFANTTLDRIEADTDAENVAERRALESAGFTREEVFSGHRVVGGERHDSVLYGIARSRHECYQR